MPTVHLYFRTQLTGDNATISALAEQAQALSDALVAAGMEPGGVSVVADEGESAAPPEE